MTFSRFTYDDEDVLSPAAKLSGFVGFKKICDQIDANPSFPGQSDYSSDYFRYCADVTGTQFLTCLSHENADDGRQRATENWLWKDGAQVLMIQMTPVVPRNPADSSAGFTSQLLQIWSLDPEGAESVFRGHLPEAVISALKADIVAHPSTPKGLEVRLDIADGRPGLGVSGVGSADGGAPIPASAAGLAAVHTGRPASPSGGPGTASSVLSV